MSGEDSDAQQTLVTHIKPMLVPHSAGAPAFDGHYFKKYGIMDKKEMELKFFEGLPKVIKIINCQFDPNCLGFLELDEVVDNEMLPPAKPLFIPSNAAIDSSFSQALTVKPKSDIEACQDPILLSTSDL
ncbi:hypothetical protein M422DRAFT_251211 [Sphaerobolus stellatus SS14]|uniref:Uncharacterized protein n=1 Tax=Sphaerobolus stellatus (strain SS14) TaxID=990650 RepID=A0A0C9W319_SPHS4|nr:hypothetical protein M422DRAFT_251211 [Sphaerobolus stellatus SS14]